LDDTTRFRAAEAPRTVLVVDDDAEVRELMAGYLRARGLDVVEAANGLEALLKFRLVRPQAVVLDILMPRLGGLQALQRIRALDQNVAVVAVTGSPDEELRAQILASGATAILSKPVPLKGLWAALGSDHEDDVAAARVARWPARAEPTPAGGGTPAGRVLIVDDEADVRSTLQQYVTMQGCEVRVAADGASALGLIRADPPDVVLLDIQMPGLSGIDALKAIQEAAPGLKVIMISGAASFELAKETLAHGAFDFIPKPPDLKALSQTLQAAFLMKRLEAEWPVERAADD
jgi:DNA-binding NtrC family response regulator